MEDMATSSHARASVPGRRDLAAARRRLRILGRHDPRVMASPPAVEAFEKFVQAERELLALLQQRVPQDQRMLEQMRGAGRGT
jgi:hypothetical protein